MLWIPRVIPPTPLSPPRSLVKLVRLPYLLADSKLNCSDLLKTVLLSGYKALEDYPWGGITLGTHGNGHGLHH